MNQGPKISAREVRENNLGICGFNKNSKVAYRDEKGPRQYQPVDVSDLNLKCAGDDCGTDIKDLPFQPTMNQDGTPARPVYCKDCNSKRKPAFRR